MTNVKSDRHGGTPTNIISLAHTYFSLGVVSYMCMMAQLPEIEKVHINRFQDRQHKLKTIISKYKLAETTENR